LGGGSNLLIREAGVSGVVIRLAAPCFERIAIDGTKLTAGAGAKLGYAVTQSVTEGLAGRVLSLPMHPYLEPDVQDRVIEALGAAISNARG
jgi:dTDP-4-amino-4,6-dideoxygalactose transaminase